MTPEEWAERAIAIVKTDVPKGVPLRVIIEEVIHAAVAEAVAGIADKLDEAAAFYKRMALGKRDPNHVTAAALTHEAAAIRARSRGEREG